MSVAAVTNALFAVDDASQIGAARRGVAAMAEAAGLSEAAVGRASIVASELATNLFNHARDGRLLARQRDDLPGGRMIELIALDSGPGMTDIERCMRDGHSTAGTAGNGLGAVRRLSDSFDISSTPGAGTAVLARVGEASPTRPPRPMLRLGVVCLPMGGEHACGDGWEWQRDERGASLLVFDGLGHGMLAEKAADVARDAFRGDPQRAPEEALRIMHDRLQGTRGGAAAIARIDLERGTLRYAGVGNIGGMLHAGERRRGLPSHNGILGSIVSRVQAFDYAWSEGDTLVMHSDGLKSRWHLDAAPAAARHDPALLAGLLYRDFQRGRDDVAVAVVSG
jgi:anti-sigma regulatory factor (Ser/Thr protein kinase)